MGEVYRADDLELNQSVALKFLPEQVARNAADLARLRAEVRTARQIAHPNVCRTYDIAEADGQVFVVMEYVDGEDLASVLRRLGRPSSDKALEIARQLCLGLGAAHENGVLHRDLKPANVMIDGRGRVRITDFGLAGTAEEIAAEGGIAGTPGYMAPEQRRSGGGSVQSDVYSLGLVLYEVFTGKRVSDMTPRPDPSRRGADSSVITPSSIVADIDPAVERVILRCLEHDPAQRPQSVYAVYGALPGGDPLAAAVAAGETPSPELVANAGVEGSVRPLFAGIAVAIVIAGLAAISIVQRPLLGGMNTPVQVLSVRAAQILKQVTGADPPRYSSQGIRYAPAPEDSAVDGDSLAAAGVRAPLAPPRAKQYWKRWSPEPLVRTNIHDPGSTIDQPRPSIPGSARIVLGMDGRLLALDVIPHAAWDSTKADPVDWSGALRASGCDPDRIVPVRPPAEFAAPGDTVAAWRISAPTAPDTILVAAAFQGRITHLDTYVGGTALGDLALRQDERSVRPMQWVWLLLWGLIPMVGSIVLARQNLKMGRGDVRGALMLGITIVILYVLEFLFTVNVGELGPHEVLQMIVFQAPIAHALLHATLLAVAYLAIEPYVRRLWPNVLVTWARIVSGRWRDPTVGRDILIGATWGVAAHLLQEASRLLGPILGLTREPAQVLPVVIRSAMGATELLSTVPFVLAVAILRATVFFTILVVLRFILRSNRAAAVGVVILFTFQSLDFGEGTIWLTGVATLINMSVGLFLALRLGYFAAIASVFFSGLATGLPWTSDFGAWFAPQTIFAWGIMALLLTYGFVTATRGRSLFSDPLSDPVIGGRQLGR